MKYINVRESDERRKFAKEAANYLDKNPDKKTYTSGEVVCGALFAARWNDDSVLVLTIDQMEEPEVYTCLAVADHSEGEIK
jgi:hypothetical protein